MVVGLVSNPLVLGSPKLDNSTKCTTCGRYAPTDPVVSDVPLIFVWNIVPEHGGTKDDPRTGLECRWMERHGTAGKSLPRFPFLQ